MRAILRRRLAVLESKLKPVKAVDNLDAEIRVMTATERSSLRDFLLFLKDGGQQCDAAFDSLKLAAEESVMSAKQRLNAT